MSHYHRNRHGRYTRLSAIESLLVWFPIIVFLIFVVRATLGYYNIEPVETAHAQNVDFLLPHGVVMIQSTPSLNLSTSTKPLTPAYHAKLPKKYSQAQIEVAKRIVEIAREEKFDRISFLLSLADCEASFNPKNSNKVGNSPKWSVDRGAFMLNSYFYKHVSDKCAYDLTCSTKVAIQEIKAGHQNRWVCTKIILKEGRVSHYSAFLK